MYLELKDEIIPEPAVMFARRREIQRKIWGPPKRNCIVHRPLPKNHQPSMPPPEPKTSGQKDTEIPEWRSLPPGPITIRRIIWIVAAYYKITPSNLTSGSRIIPIARPRQIAAYLAKRLTKQSYPDIGRRLGGRDHTTILHAFRLITLRIQKNPSLASDIHLLETTLQNLKAEFLETLAENKNSTDIKSDSKEPTHITQPSRTDDDATDPPNKPLPHENLQRQRPQTYKRGSAPAILQF